MILNRKSAFGFITQILVIIGITTDGIVLTAASIVLAPFFTGSHALGWFGVCKASIGSVPALSGANRRAYTDKLLFAAWRGLFPILALPFSALDTRRNGEITSGRMRSCCLSTAAAYFLVFKPLVRQSAEPDGS